MTINPSIIIENIDLFEQYLKFNQFDFRCLFSVCSIIHNKFSEYNPELILKFIPDFYNSGCYDIRIDLLLHDYDDFNIDDLDFKEADELYIKCDTIIMPRFINSND